MTSSYDEFEQVDSDDFAPLFQNIEDLKRLSTDNADYFDGSPKGKAERGVDVFEQIGAALAGVELLCKEIAPHVNDYDFSKETKGNGFRSLLTVTNRCLTKLVRLSQRCCKKRDRLTFASSALDDIVAYTEVLKCLSRLLLSGTAVLEGCKPETSVFPDEDALDKEVGWDVESFPRVPFYGKCLGFQYCSSMRPLLRSVCIAMAAYGESFRKHGPNHGNVRLAISSVGNSWKYIMNSKQRAEMVVDLTTHCDLRFAKAFWSLTEGALLKHVPRLMCPSVDVNKTLELPLEDVVLPHRDNSGERISISPPRNEKGEAQPVHVRVIVHKLHKGKEIDGFGKKRMMSTNCDGLLVHFHGGGFVSQSSKTHEIYLRDWARDLGITILSVDYSLAPEHPFPRGFDDCFFAYSWALANYTDLYTNAKFVCIAGDSAGGNLSVAVSLKAIECGIRVPDGIVPVYGPFLIRYSISPSRLLSVMDPLLHNGLLIKCLGAYAGQEHPVEDSGIEEGFIEMSTSVDPADSDILQEMVSDTARVFDYDNDEDNDSNEATGQDDDVTDTGDQTDSGNMNESEFELVRDGDATEEPSGGVFQESYRYQASVHMSNVQCTINSGWSKLKTMVASSVIGSSEDHTLSPVHRGGSAPDLTLREKSPVTAQPLLRHCKSEDPLQKSVDGLLPFCHPPITSNPYMSPYLASDELLSQLPPTYLIAAHLDPLLDDSVAFACRLRSLKKPVRFYVLDNLPHGFLNFALASKEAQQGSELIVQCIAEVVHVHLKRSKQRSFMNCPIPSSSVDSGASSPSVSPSVSTLGQGQPSGPTESLSGDALNELTGDTCTKEVVSSTGEASKAQVLIELPLDKTNP